jgi:hypothetical protein
VGRQPNGWCGRQSDLDADAWQIQSNKVLPLLAPNAASSRLFALAVQLDLITSLRLPFIAGSGRPLVPGFVRMRKQKIDRQVPCDGRFARPRNVRFVPKADIGLLLLDRANHTFIASCAIQCV